MAFGGAGVKNGNSVQPGIVILIYYDYLCAAVKVTATFVIIV